MKAIAAWLKAAILFILVVSARAAGSPALDNAHSASPPAASCSSPEYRQFDFWVGDWDAFEVGSPDKEARAHVDLILDGCVLREDYAGVDGHEGQSFSIYDATRKVWHQSWVTNRGELLIIEGTFENGQMVLSGVDHPAGVGDRHVRGIWKPVSDGVRETAAVSTDGGKTWKPWFDLVFRPHKP